MRHGCLETNLYIHPEHVWMINCESIIGMMLVVARMHTFKLVGVKGGSAISNFLPAG